MLNFSYFPISKKNAKKGFLIVKFCHDIDINFPSIHDTNKFLLQDIQRLEKEHRVNFLLLKKKVISTE